MTQLAGSAGGHVDPRDSAGGHEDMHDSAGGHVDPRDSAGGHEDMHDSAGGRVDPDGPAGSAGAANLLEAGRIGRAHGLDGSFHVTRPDARLLAGLEEIFVNGHPARIERRAGTDERPILRLAGHAGREAAEALRGAPLAVPPDRAPLLEPGEYWAHELVGCAVWDGERRVGEVRRMLPLPSCEALEVARADGGELLVPMVRDAVRAVDVGARRIDVDLAFLGE